MSEETKPTAFQKWYGENKADYNRKRMERRLADPEYRRRQDSYRPDASKPDPLNAKNLTAVAAELDITIWVLGEWRKKKYFPVPVEAKGSLWVHEANLPLLKQLKDFFDTHGRRVSRRTREPLEDLTNLIFANWTELEK